MNDPFSKSILKIIIMATAKKTASKKVMAKKKDSPCWKGYKKVGTKVKGGKTVNDCVPT